MQEKKRFEPPKVETFRSDELIVETAFTGEVWIDSPPNDVPV